MRFLLDENLSPIVADALRQAGHDAVHLREIGLLRAGDGEVLDRGRVDHRVLVSADTDFGRLLAASGATLPSVILLRREAGRRASAHAGLVLANLGQVAADLDAGAIVVLEASRVRVRRLPLTIPETTAQ